MPRRRTSTLGALGLGWALAGCGAEPPFEDFAIGANLPWRNYGHDFGRAWSDDGVTSPNAQKQLNDDFDVLIGADVARWFVYADGRALDQSTPEEVIEDLDAALELADSRGITLMPVLFDFLWFDTAQDIDGIQLFGRTERAADPKLRAELIDTWIAPLAERYANDPRVFAFDLINEPEWALSDGLRNPIVGDPVPFSTMRAFVLDVADALRGGRPLTVGSAGFDDLAEYWLDVDLDLLQLHHYETSALPPTSDLDTDLPVIVGEFASAEGDVQTAVEDFQASGYAGALPWSLNGNDTATDRKAMAAFFGN